MGINNLVFYDKSGYRIPTIINAEGYHVGSLNFPLIGVGLFETEKVMILEKVLYSNEITHNAPIIDDNGGVITAELLEDENNSYFSLFTYDQENDIPSPVFSRELSGDFLSPVSYFDATSGDRQYKNILSTPNNRAYEFNVCIKGDQECATTDKLILKYNTKIIAIFDLYGELEDHDDRLTVLLNNISRNVLTQQENTIFRSSDINEDLMNPVLLNEKRKELLLEYSNIFPYLPSYIGLIRILSFFGYPDIRLKEHWKNIFDDRTSLVPVILDDPQRLEYPYYKSGKISLFYDILREIPDEYDQFGLPELERPDIFSPEEVLIKMFALKNWLVERNVGDGNICEIVGEASYYTRYDMRVWNDMSQTIYYDNQPKINFIATSLTSGYVDDIRHLIERNEVIPRINGENYDISIENEIGDVPISHFDSWNQSADAYGSLYPDVVENPIADANLLSVNLPKATWGSTGVSWDEFNDHILTITWENIDIAHYYEITWEVNRRTDTDGDTRNWQYHQRYDANTGTAVRVDIPMDGVYDVKLVLHQFNGENRTYTESRFIISKLKPINNIAFWNIIDEKMGTWDNPISWDRFGVANLWRNDHLFWDSELFYGSVQYHRINPYSLRLSSYVETLNMGEYPDTFGLINPQWDSVLANSVTWEESKWTSWDKIDIKYHKHDRIVITDVNPGSVLYIGDEFYVIPNTIADLNDVANYLNDITNGLSELTLIDQYVFTARPTGEEPTFIDMVMTDPINENRDIVGGTGLNIVMADELNPIIWTDDYSWVDLGIPWTSTIDNYQVHRNIPTRYRYHNIRVSLDTIRVPLVTPVFITRDTSGMRGITDNISWILYRKSQPNGDPIHYFNVDYKFFCFSFFEEGYYDVEMICTDNNGNRQSIYKNNQIIVQRQYQEIYE